MKKNLLKGVIPALPTPVHRDERIDEEGVQKLIKYVLDHGSNGIFILGTMGEVAHLREQEKIRMIRCARSATPDNIPFLVGVSDTGTQRVIEQAKRALDLGAEYIVALPSYFYPVFVPETIQRFYETVVEATNAEIVIYNNPIYAKTEIAFETFAKLSRDIRVVGVKNCGSDPALHRKLVQCLQGENFAVFDGFEPDFLRSASLKGSGLVTGCGCLAPHIPCQIYQGGQENNQELMEKGQHGIDRLLSFCGESWRQAVKYGLSLLGICQEHTLEPFVPISEETR
ncbi:MAG: dihydrodipicolinate synthase family protein, partial [Kiritimatiellae bacterium]|nr:dihydrodipicolinate synthase family protein [Kiritimatiellia bacterium]